MSRLSTLIELLHGVPQAALATLSASMPGYPFATAVPFALDSQHRPVLLISKLAEHSRNLAQDPKASLVVSQTLGKGEITRATLVGEMVPIEATPDWTARYLRYQPDAELFLQLGDFSFARMEVLRIQIIGGFAKATWLEGKAFLDVNPLRLDQESPLLDELGSLLSTHERLLGLDAYGADVMIHGTRQRLTFQPSPVLAEAIPKAFVNAIQRHRKSMATAGEGA